MVVGWVQGLRNSVTAFGPPPLKQMTEDLLRAYKTTIDFWVEDLKVTPLVSPRVTEVSAPGTVVRDERHGNRRRPTSREARAGLSVRLP